MSSIDVVVGDHSLPNAKFILQDKGLFKGNREITICIEDPQGNPIYEETRNLGSKTKLGSHSTAQAVSDTIQGIIKKTALLMQREEHELGLLESELYREIARGIGNPTLIEEYNNTRERKQERRKTDIGIALRSRIIKLEYDAQRSVARDATFATSEQEALTQFTVPDTDLERRVRALFHPDDNLRHRPLARFGQPNGNWEKHAREILGEGFYERLRIIEDDLDEFYIAVSEKLEELGSASDITREAYHQAIRETAPFEQVRALLEREYTTNLEALERFRQKALQGAVDYRFVFSDIQRELGPQSEKIAYTKKPFTFTLTPQEAKEDNEEQIAKLRRSFVDHCLDNKANIFLVDKPAILDGGDVIVVNGEYRGCLFIAQTRGVSNEHMKKSGTAHYDPNNQLNNYTLVLRKDARSARRLTKEDEPRGILEQLFDETLEVARQAHTDHSLKLSIEPIAQMHPYIDEEMEFLGRFHRGMVARFEAIYQEQ